MDCNGRDKGGRQETEKQRVRQRTLFGKLGPRGYWGRGEDQQYIIKSLSLQRVSLLSFATVLFRAIYSLISQGCCFHDIPWLPASAMLHVLQKIETDDRPVYVS